VKGDSLPPTAWTTGTTEGLKTGTWRAAVPRYVSAPSPCHGACPVSGDIPLWIGRMRQRDFRGAFDILARNNPFPAISGRLCHHPCESACNRSGFDSALAICRLERAVGDRALAEGWKLGSPQPARAERIAVVGGGPSGLSAAFHLRRRGYPVTLLEASSELGGLMRHGIPSYRLPREVLDSEIARILDLGIDLRLGKALETPVAFARLRAEFDAVYLAMGAGRQKRLPSLDYAKPWAMDGKAWLQCANAGRPPALGPRMVVIGGGSAAIDVARSARRFGHEVTLLALESEREMPAQPEEKRQALEEGVKLVDGSMLVRVTEGSEAGLGLECVRVSLIAGAEPGLFRLEEIAGSAFRIEAHGVVSAIGQDPDLSPLDEALCTRGALLETDAAQRTSTPHVYAGGDVASMERFLTSAIGMGKRAALAIDASFSLGGREWLAEPASGGQEPAGRLCGPGVPSERPVPLAAIATFYYPKQAKPAERRLTAAERLQNHAEVALGLLPGEVLAEAKRCFSCGTCIFCDNCFQYCPDLAVRRLSGGYEVDGDYCKGCGICVRECPTGSMEMAEEFS
jgi:NADPH-dependent glutamate synthase beta subunit-like oxidoreductase